MCRNIRQLFNFDPPENEAEVGEAAIQFVWKLSGSTRSSKINQPAFDQAVEEVSRSVQNLLSSLVTTALPRNREVEAEKAKLRSLRRFFPI
ncbi:MAG: hypothetical protein ACI845_003960 [Gammaproteobacteria bacterium]|jgi:hypothetical protein